MKLRQTFLLLATLLGVVGAGGDSSLAQDRETKVRNDRERFAEDDSWFYNDLGGAMTKARATGQPLLVVFRCLPCEACSDFDDQVIRRDPQIAPLMEKFVCARIVHANAMDLAVFQFDYDVSFAIFMMHPDGAIYGRYGTRSQREDAESDISIAGLKAALQGALRLHRAYPDVKPMLAGKQGPPPRFAAPEKYPALEDFSSELDYEGNVVKSCIHCHQVRDAEREYLRSSGKPMADEVIFPWPLPSVVGLGIDRDTRATIKSVEPESAADKAGLKVDDEISTINNQPILSIADVQWVLHNAKRSDELIFLVRRDGKPLRQTLSLQAGWREASDISWRATSWPLRRMTLGGMRLEPLPDEMRRKLGLDEDTMGLLVAHVGQYGPHAAAKKAGIQKWDVLISYDGRTDLPRETDIFAYALRKRMAGARAPVTLRRGDRVIQATLPLQ